MTMQPTIRTERLLLRPWRDADLEPFAAMNGDPRVTEFLNDQPFTRAESDANAARVRRHFDEHGWGKWAVDLPGVADFIGVCGLANITGLAHVPPSRRNRLALRPRPLGPRLRDRSGTSRAHVRLRPAQAGGNRLIHVRDQRPLAGRDGAHRNGLLSRRRFRPPHAPGRQPASPARPLPAAPH